MEAAEYLLFMDLFESRKSSPRFELLLVCAFIVVRWSMVGQVRACAAILLLLLAVGGSKGLAVGALVFQRE